MRGSAGWLIDTSALRPHVPAFAEVLIPRIRPDSSASAA